MREMRRRFRERMSTILLATVIMLVIGEVVAFVILIPVAETVSSQAKSGQRARTVQCAVYPVGSKVYADAEARGVITPKEFATYRSALRPASCPASSK